MSRTVTLSGDRPRNERLIAEFPLFQHGEYDFYFPNAHWQIGLKSSYPESLKKKVAAVLISEFVGLKSIDNIMKTYMRDVSYPVAAESRLDLRVREFVSKRISAFDGQLYALSISFNGKLSGNTVIGLLTLKRAVFSMDLLAYCGQRGALFEGVAIARMMLEQIAWAFSVANSLDENAVHKISATQSISALKTQIACAGEFYGWLSQHAHWKFDAHKKAVITNDKEKIGHMFGSSYFKATVFCAMLILTQIYFDCVFAMCPEELHALSGEKGARTTRPDHVRHEARELLAEIVECDPQDYELRKLAEMLGDKQV